jgi:hypothetical protein
MIGTMFLVRTVGLSSTCCFWVVVRMRTLAISMGALSDILADSPDAGFIIVADMSC